MVGKTIMNEPMNIVGCVEDGVAVFKGVPYAEPPVGELRFRPPVERKKWTETLDCTEWGDSNYQMELPILPLKSKMGDDCLNLNIYVPLDAKEGDGRPVFVWLHGGAFAVEASTSYDLSAFARDGIIAVAVEYRIGALGFLALDSLKSKEYGNGNWGTLDQIFALKWIQKNIGKFGGDRNNVTVAGQSSGSFSVGNMLLSPMAKGLFRNAILESMFLSHFFDASISSEKARGISKGIAERLGVEDSPEGVEKLRKMDSMELVKASPFNFDVINGNGMVCWPLFDGVVLPKDPVEALKTGNFNKDVNILSGFNKEEGLLFTIPQTATEENLNKSIRLTYPESTADKVVEFYAKMDAPAIYKVSHHIALGSLTIGMSKANDLMLGKVKNLFCYQFDYSPSEKMPPTHASEMGFALGFKELAQPFPDFTKTMHGYWANFARTGNPNGQSLVEWEQYSSDRKVMHLDAECKMGKVDQQEIIDLLSPLYFG